MAQQEEPLYDFPEPTQPCERKFLGHQRGQGSLRSISVLDRLLLTVPVWLQLSINPATALHILQREPPGTFLVRKSRTSQRNVLCVRLADDSVPSFVQQFGIREEHSTLSLETSAISFPDLPKLISFYCVSRDVLPFPLELPEVIAKATSHKELESISHMGIEFWSSQLNVRGPREAPKPCKDAGDKKPNAGPAAHPAADPSKSSAAQPDPAPQFDSGSQLKAAPGSDGGKQPDTLFREFCPITTRSPRELDCGSGLGALCFINPLFLQAQGALCRRNKFKRSIKVRVSTETSTLLSPPLAPPPPPPLMPKTKRKCRAQRQAQGRAGQARRPLAREQVGAQTGAAQGRAGVEGGAPLRVPEDTDYTQPSPVIGLSHPPALSPHLPPSVSPAAPPLLPKASPTLCPLDSAAYQSPFLTPKIPLSVSPRDSPPPSPSPPPTGLVSLSPFTSPCFAELAEADYRRPAAGRQRSEGEAGEDESREEDEGLDGEREAEATDLLTRINAASLTDNDSCSSFSSLEGEPETPRPRSPHQQDGGTSL